ncbi:C40 family peptidase [Panacagrimonas sp.]|uniref:C40 family peptidase n=1 Tax=Panacagrimonas sp. TaxID=2480088 RepID=UPI003B524DF0
MRRSAVVLALILLVAACSSSRYRPTPETDALRRGIVLDALGQIGRPYRYGGTTPEGGFDCSGLVQYVYGLQGLSVPRTTREQFKAGERIKLRHAEPGDLLFYSFSGRGIDHVAVYLGDGQAVHAPSSGKQVIVAPIENRWWKQRYRDAVRVIW